MNIVCTRYYFLHYSLEMPYLCVVNPTFCGVFMKIIFKNKNEGITHYAKCEIYTH